MGFFIGPQSSAYPRAHILVSRCLRQQNLHVGPRCATCDISFEGYTHTVDTCLESLQSKLLVHSRMYSKVSSILQARRLGILHLDIYNYRGRKRRKSTNPPTKCEPEQANGKSMPFEINNDTKDEQCGDDDEGYTNSPATMEILRSRAFSTTSSSDDSGSSWIRGKARGFERRNSMRSKLRPFKPRSDSEPGGFAASLTLADPDRNDSRQGIGVVASRATRHTAHQASLAGLRHHYRPFTKQGTLPRSLSTATYHSPGKLSGSFPRITLFPTDFADVLEDLESSRPSSLILIYPPAIQSCPSSPICKEAHPYVRTLQHVENLLVQLQCARCPGRGRQCPHDLLDLAEARAALQSFQAILEVRGCGMMDEMLLDEAWEEVVGRMNALVDVTWEGRDEAVAWVE